MAREHETASLSRRIELLNVSNSDLELWWDSSPLAYRRWLDGDGRSYSKIPLFVYNENDSFSSESILCGATTNPPLVLKEIDADPEYWGEWLRDAARPGMHPRDAMWMIYREITRRGAAMLIPLYERTDGCHGWICAQVDPRDSSDIDAMVDQAKLLHDVSQNVMVKMPANAAGIEGIRRLASEGVPTNATLGFTVSQLVAVAEANEKGRFEAASRGIDAARFRSCAVMMLGRYEDEERLRSEAEARGIEITNEDLRWAGIAIFRKAHRLFTEQGYTCKLMAASMRAGPSLPDGDHVWHLEKLAGAKAVLTVFPNIYEAFFEGLDVRLDDTAISRDIPADVVEKLLRLPYFVEAFDERGIEPEAFDRHVAYRATITSFARAMASIEAFAASKVLPA